jgi:hypothetical protein
VSRWFSGKKPNWTLNAISDLANSLNVELSIEAVERNTRKPCTRLKDRRSTSKSVRNQSERLLTTIEARDSRQPRLSPRLTLN